MDALLKRAANEYDELCKLATENTYEELKEKLRKRGCVFNEQEDLFDTNYCSMRVTIWDRNGEPYVHPHVDIYEDGQGHMVYENYDITTVSE